MPPPISPWAPHAVLPSPDGKLLAEIEAMEIGMGGPTFGELSISNRMTDAGRAWLLRWLRHLVGSRPLSGAPG